MKLKWKVLAAATALALSAGANAQISGNVVKIGVMNDQSGTYADIAGPGSTLAAKMAVEDFKAKEKGLNVEVVFADHQNKPDVGSQIANKWYDADGVDVIVDVPTSSVSFQFAGFVGSQPLDEDGISVLGFVSRPDLERTGGDR